MTRKEKRIAALRSEWAARRAEGEPDRGERLNYWSRLMRAGVSADQIDAWDREEQRQKWLARYEVELFPFM